MKRGQVLRWGFVWGLIEEVGDMFRDARRGRKIGVVKIWGYGETKTEFRF